MNAGASAVRPRDVDPAEVAILADAEDPGTAPLRLQELATDQPIARPAVAAIPAAGPELLTWLRALDGPALMIPLARRSGDTSPQASTVTLGEDLEFQVDVADTPQQQKGPMAGKKIQPAQEYPST